MGKKRYFVTRWKDGMDDEEYCHEGLLSKKKAGALCKRLRDEDVDKEYFTPVTAHDGTDRGFWNIIVFKVFDRSGYSEEVTVLPDGTIEED